jgi:hypothetical protein
MPFWKVRPAAQWQRSDPGAERISGSSGQAAARGHGCGSDAAETCDRIIGSACSQCRRTVNFTRAAHGCGCSRPCADRPKRGSCDSCFGNAGCDRCRNCAGCCFGSSSSGCVHCGSRFRTGSSFRRKHTGSQHVVLTHASRCALVSCGAGRSGICSATLTRRCSGCPQRTCARRIGSCGGRRCGSSSGSRSTGAAACHHHAATCPDNLHDFEGRFGFCARCGVRARG